MTLIPTTERTQYCFADCGKEICECKPTNRIEVDKEKTAMQMLIEVIGSRLADKSDKTAIHKLEICLIVAKAILQKEQEQIEHAYEVGFDDGIESELGYRTRYENQRDYYQSKYGGER